MTFSEQLKFSGSAPTDYAVTLAEVKSQLSIAHSDEDTFLSSLIMTACAYAERITNRSLISRSWELLTDFPCGDGPDAAITLPISPVISVASVTYYDADGNSTVLAGSSYISQTGDRAALYPSGNVSWPTTSADRLHPVSVVFVAGYDGTADSPVDLTNIPEPIRQAILLHIAHLYENREAVMFGRSIEAIALPFGYDALIEPYRVKGF